MRSSILRQSTFVSLLCAGLLCCPHGYAGGKAPSYSGRDVASGVVAASGFSELVVRERNGTERRFMRMYEREDRPDTTVTVDGRKATFDDIEVGMRVQIVFYSKVDGKKIGTEDFPLPIISVKAISNPPEKPKP